MNRTAEENRLVWMCAHCDNVRPIGPEHVDRDPLVGPPCPLCGAPSTLCVPQWFRDGVENRCRDFFYAAYKHAADSVEAAVTGLYSDAERYERLRQVVHQLRGAKA